MKEAWKYVNSCSTNGNNGCMDFQRSYLAFPKGWLYRFDTRHFDFFQGSYSAFKAVSYGGFYF